MKLVIEISGDDYKYIKRLNAGYTDYITTLKLYNAVRNGTPLDDIRKEIESNLITHGQVIEGEYYPDDAEAINYGLRKALEIIDRHIRERSE